MQGWPTWRGQAFMLPTVRIPKMRLQSILDFGHFHPSISLSLYSKGVRPAWYPYVTLTKTACGLGSWGRGGSSESSFQAEDNGSVGISEASAAGWGWTRHAAGSWVSQHPLASAASAGFLLPRAGDSGYLSPQHQSLSTIYVASPWHRTCA